MIFMMFATKSFHALPHRFVGFNSTSVYCLVFSNCATSFPILVTLRFARHCCWHRNYQLSTRIPHKFLEFLIIKINEVNTTQFSGIVKLQFVDSSSVGEKNVALSFSLSFKILGKFPRVTAGASLLSSISS